METLHEIKDRLERLPEKEPDLRLQDLSAVMAYHKAKLEEALEMRKKLDEELQRF